MKIIAGLGALLLLITIKTVDSDGLVRWESARLFFQTGHLDDKKFSLIGPLFSAPLYFVDWLTDSHFNAMANFNVIVFLAGLALLFRILRPVFDTATRWLFVVMLIYASMFPFHVLNFFGETFSAVCLAIGSALLCLDRPWLGWTALSLGAMNTPSLLPAVGLIAAHHAWRSGKWMRMTGVGVPVILIFCENWLRRGSIFAASYDGEKFSTPFLVGFFSLLFCWGKGLIFYTPGLALAGNELKGKPSPRKLLLESWMLASLGLLLVYSSWWDWSGDLYWGPRFMLFCSFPASLALALSCSRPGSRGRYIFLAGLLLFCFWIGYDALIFGEHARPVCRPEERCWYQLANASWVRPWTYPRPLKPRELVVAAIWVAGYATVLSIRRRDLLGSSS